ncbi:COG3014 family protein [Desulfoluna spongiiphila]|uniref:Tetratricopeptide repeat-containing protein n=1 Tax=Desulfoluna spongiiphila TaxID=419481 RepID=A0A1G5E6Y7_9BACT|nr:hypothetical protein [Desulfoluna spongiiphila]SCY22675.1 hypothetical protein SAMN05216233_105206 [Desulfoluna spongiiphila]VVS91625.1 prokaryotic membrane lipoprotein lipid attachment site profile [Desulfoluna spongiiphila]
MKRLVLLVALLIATTGCAPTFNYANLDSLLKAGDCVASKEMIKTRQSDYGKHAQLLYHLDCAMIFYECGDLKSAAAEFSQADEMAQALWTKSLSAGAASFLVNDLIIDYPGEDFERALINMMAAFTYIRGGDYESALVECRKLNTLLTEYNDQYESKNVYKEDALGRYISGILSEMDGEYSDAYIYYYEAFRAYKDYNAAYGTPTPPSLYADLLRVAVPADRVREAKRLTKGYTGTVPSHRATRKKGRIVYVQLNGKAPKKVENKITHLAPTGPVSIAFPRYVTFPPGCRDSGLVLTDTNGSTLTTPSALAENITAIAVKNLDDRKTRIWTKTIARAVAKQVAVHAAAKQIEKEQGEFAGMLAQLAGQVAASATEKADTRSWRTLPGEIYLASRFVEPGEYKASAITCAGVDAYLETVNVKAGETVFVFNHTMH